MSTENSWFALNGQAITEPSVSPLKDYKLLKLYNPMIGKEPDDKLAGKVLVSIDGEYVVLDKEIQNIIPLKVTKCFMGYAPRLDNEGRAVYDGDKVIQDFYFTPETSVYDKSNITIAKSTEQGPVVLGKGNYASFIEFTTSPTINGKTNPLFDTIAKNGKGEKYPVSVMKPVYFLYFQMDGQLYKIRLGASYGNYKEPKDGTFISAEKAAMNAFKEMFPTTRFEIYFMNLNIEIKREKNFFYIYWTYAGINNESIMNEVHSNVLKTNSDVDKYNNSRFVGIDFLQLSQSIPYQFSGLMLGTSSKVSEVIKETTVEPIIETSDDISIEDLPF